MFIFTAAMYLKN